MDTVGEIIAERERQRYLPLGLGTFLAVALHASIAAALIWSSMIHPVRFITPRAVAVRLMPAGSLKGGEAPAPAPEPVPETKKILKPEPEDVPPPPTDKALLLPAKEDEKKTATSRVAPERAKAPDVSLPSSGDSAGGGGGGAIGAGGNVGVSGAAFDSDFQFSYYVERMLVAIGMNWFKPSSPGSISPVIHFKIEKDGTISDAAVERSSGLPFVDRAALRAVISSSPLPPLPTEYGGGQLGVHLKFD